MDVQLFSTVFERGLMSENIGIGRITSYLQQRDVSVLVTYFKNDDIDAAIQKIDCGVSCYGFSLYQTNILFFLKIMKHIKAVNPNAIIVVGSKYSSIYYKDILKSSEFNAVDIVALGDGEESLFKIIDCIKHGNDVFELAVNYDHIASKVSFENKKADALDINTLPFPDREWVKSNNFISAYICDCHGCVGKCSFCTYSTYYHKWNGRSPESLFEEIMSLHEKYSIHHFIFTGGSFEDPGELGKKKIEELCHLLLQKGVPLSFRYFLRSETFKDNPKDRNLLMLMKKAGLNIAIVGIESGNEDDLLLYNKRGSIQDNGTILRLLRETGIYEGMYGFIMFNPYSTLERLRLNYEFLADNHVVNPNKYISKMLLHKGTKIYMQADNDGLVDHDRIFYIDKEFEYKFIHDEINPIWQFVNTYFYTDIPMQINDTIEEMMGLVFCNENILHKGKEYVELTTQVFNRYEDRLRTYFYMLFVKRDIKYCESHYEIFMAGLEVDKQELLFIKNKVLRSIFREVKR